MRAGPTSRRRGFTLVELLVTISVIVVLVAMFGGAISAARSSQKTDATSSAIVRLDRIVMAQFRRYETRSVAVSLLPSGITNKSAARAWYIRRNMMSGDMPDRWTDVALLASDTTSFPRSPAQAAYIATWNALTSTQRTLPGSDAKQHVNFQYGGAECLFMIVMQGGFASCLECNDLAKLKKGDKDGDGMSEFWDDWNNPIDYILWAPGFLNSGDTTRFFNPLDQAFPSSGTVRAGLGMRPLIYSAGPDGEYGLNRNSEQSTLNRGSSPVAGADCGNPTEVTTATSGAPAGGDGKRADNVVNVEIKVGA